ncbi:MAG: aminodeoxychorismate synthase component I [Paraglaciecola sp.]|nr:aminodeoxychorismate synthase component I [Paraglaciecola sp.]NCT46418.1 aminodeoxychorismate synthase component I [Paraglaciecola sp.]
MSKQSSTKIRITELGIEGEVSLANMFASVATRPWSMLLDSADSQHPDARFDIMVADPIATILTHQHDNQVWCKADNGTETRSGDPFVLIEDIMRGNFGAHLAPTSDYSHLPFLAGAMGFFGYDLARQLEKLPDQHSEHYNAPDMAIGLYAWSLVKDNHNGRIYYCRVNEFSAPSPEHWLAIAKQTLTAQQNAKNERVPEPQDMPFSLDSAWQANMQAAQYYQQIDKIHHYLRAGDCYQINFAQRFEAQYSGDEWQAYVALRNANTAPFSAFIRLPQCSILSISPERFLAVKDKQVQTKPIKGTRPRANTWQQDQAGIEALLNSEKDQAENLMIVDLLRNDLSKHCKANSVKVPALFKIESFPAVHHLVSTVVGELDEHSTPLALFKGAFPGGSITGAPKVRAMQIIDELEPHKRNIYCGSIAYIGVRQDMDSSICIRTLLAENGRLYCWAGGGIVLDSEAHAEYQESLDKVAKILPILMKDRQTPNGNRF